MIIVLKPNVKSAEVDQLISKIESIGHVEPHKIEGAQRDVIGLVGDTSKVDIKLLLADQAVDEVLRVSEPYKLANRAFYPEDTVIQVGQESIGGNRLMIAAGPCSVESEEQVVDLAKRLKKAGANFLRGGAYKPRTSPYSFQGHGEEGLKMLNAAKAETGLAIVSECMSIDQVDAFVKHEIDIIQIGARNMQNFNLLREVGKTNIPVVLKRGMSATYQEWLMSAEYIMAEGNHEVILCERGIRTFETETRNALDIQAVPVIRKKSHLPIVLDPSHAAGDRYIVPSGAMAAIAAGADGLMIEVHENPDAAWSDGQQTLSVEQFEELMGKLALISQAVDRLLPAQESRQA